MFSKNENLACTFNVCDYGAVGDGMTKDTVGVQNAVDKCAQNGGGTLFFPPGKYLIGTIDLCTNLTVHISSGATLIGSPDYHDYQKDARCRNGINGYLFYAENVENLSILGEGCIDGQGRLFWHDEMCNSTARKPKENRPHAILQFSNSRNIKICGLMIKNAPTYSVWLLGCEDVVIDSVRIDNPYDGPNTDGLDIDCCANVSISNCNISTGDDCIALKSDVARLGHNKDCNNIIVSNCILSSSTCAIRVGYEGDGGIHDCLFSDIVINKASKAIDIISVLPGKLNFTEIESGAKIERIKFSNILSKNVKRAIYIWAGRETQGNFQGYIREVFISNYYAMCEKGSYIGSATAGHISNISLVNVNLKINGKEEILSEFNPPGVWDAERLPWGLYCEAIDGLLLDNIQIDMSDVTGEWNGDFSAVNVKDIKEKS